MKQAWAPELIMEKERTTKITPLIKPKGGLAPQASPIIREPKFGRRNSDLETLASNFTLSNMVISATKNQGSGLKTFFQRMRCNHRLCAVISHFSVPRLSSCRSLFRQPQATFLMRGKPSKHKPSTFASQRVRRSHPPHQNLCTRIDLFSCALQMW